MDLEYLEKNLSSLPELLLNKAISIYLYGSVARNDVDENSDCDIFVCVNDCTDIEYNELINSVADWQERYNCEFAFYQLSALRKMQSLGSYFLWHIKTEGILLYQRTDEFESILCELPPYGRTIEDFREYDEILNDIRTSVLQDELAVLYDLSVLAVLARNICIGSCYLQGNMDFGRRTPVIKCMQYWKGEFPFSLSEYDRLYEFRLTISRGKELGIETPSSDYVLSWWRKIRALLDLAMTLER